MLFVLSKVFWAVASPLNLILLVLGAGSALSLLGGPRWRRRGARVLAGGLTLLFAAAVLPLDHWLTATLERRFAEARVLPERVDGIVALGGGIDVDVSRSRGRVDLGESGERVVALAALARRYPEARLVYSSGYRVSGDTVTEADLAAELLATLGVPPARLTLERRSRNTRENALFSFELVEPAPQETWLLVTSIWHLPRAVGTFRRAGWSVVPYGVDDRSFAEVRWTGIGPLARLARLGTAGKEWIGLLAYRLFGWTDSLFPAPRSGRSR